MPRSSLVLALAILGLALLAPACKKPAGVAGSCHRPDNTCVEFGPAEAAAGQRMCAGAMWSTGAGSCPPGALGTCKHGEETELVYAGPPSNYTAAGAKTACEFKGGSFAGASPAK